MAYASLAGMIAYFDGLAERAEEQAKMYRAASAILRGQWHKELQQNGSVPDHPAEPVSP